MSAFHECSEKPGLTSKLQKLPLMLLGKKGEQTSQGEVQTCELRSTSIVSIMSVDSVPSAASTILGFLWSRQATRGDTAFASRRQNVSFAEHIPPCTGHNPEGRLGRFTHPSQSMNAPFDCGKSGNSDRSFDFLERFSKATAAHLSTSSKPADCRSDVNKGVKLYSIARA
jgi:hypothetical protein